MLKRTTAISLALLMTLQGASTAWAQSTLNKESISIDEIMKMAESVDAESVADLKMALSEVIRLQNQLKTVTNQNEKDIILKYANKLQVVLVALTTAVMHGQFKATQQSTMLLSLGTASAVLNAYIRHYKADKNITAEDLSRLVFESSTEISNNKAMTSEMKDIVLSLNQASSMLIENKGAMEEMIKSLGGGQDLVVLGSVVYLVLHLVSPKTAQSVDAVAKDVLPKVKLILQNVRQLSQKAVEATKKPTTVTAGAAGAPDIIGLAAGLSTEESQNLILQTLINLDTTAQKIKTEIRRLETGK
jgi:hypothetical protein